MSNISSKSSKYGNYLLNSYKEFQFSSQAFYQANQDLHGAYQRNYDSIMGELLTFIEAIGGDEQIVKSRKGIVRAILNRNDLPQSCTYIMADLDTGNYGAISIEDNPDKHPRQG